MELFFFVFLGLEELEDDLEDVEDFEAVEEFLRDLVLMCFSFGTMARWAPFFTTLTWLCIEYGEPPPSAEALVEAVNDTTASG